jgi:DNA-binding Lrp family transcriptional regulator
MTDIKCETDAKIIEFLEENGPSFLGEVVKELKISYTTGINRIHKLISKGVIRHSYPPSQYELNSEPN